MMAKASGNPKPKPKKKMIANLHHAFNPESIAIIGASPTPGKLGYIMVKNLQEGRYAGRLYPVNPSHDEVLGMRCYKTVEDIKGKVDLAIISTPAPAVPQVLEQCGKKKVKSAVILSSGFSEVGLMDAEKEMLGIAQKYSIAVVGPNCLGILDPNSRVDSFFFPTHKLQRPKPGGIAIVSQSGGIGVCIIDLAAFLGIGISKVISYGNGTVLDESDMLEYLENDDNTQLIVLYIEGIRDGRRLLEVMERVNRKKPIIVLKAGREAGACKAAHSHTGNLAGNYLAYQAAFRQSKVVEADNLMTIFDTAKLLSQPLPKSDRIGIVTNGGGLGILAADAVEKRKLPIAQLSQESLDKLRTIIPMHVTPNNPLDIAADSDVGVYEKAIQVMMDDPNVDLIMINVLFQAPKIDERIIDVLVRFSDMHLKPVMVVGLGGGYTDIIRRVLDGKGVPTYSEPDAAANAIRMQVDYADYRRKARAMTVPVRKR
ncbi:MAG: acetate--CoA ligase family protein [Candidatus Bilamarchaeaceae archaeon]